HPGQIACPGLALSAGAASVDQTAEVTQSNTNVHIGGACIQSGCDQTSGQWNFAAVNLNSSKSN
ncbi:MAG TPA: hypothetical protein VFS96_07540, partial [Nitrolancea sp.]|nr:hypothetical protein [Nitrolancea sp.]